MKSTKMLAATVGGLVLVVIAAVGAAFGIAWLAVAALGLLMVAQLVVLMDTNRRTRYLPRKVRTLLQTVKVDVAPGAMSASPGAVVDAAATDRPTPHPQGAESATAVQHELTGAVRLIQAQYLGRLDRAQTALETAAEDLRAARNDR